VIVYIKRNLSDKLVLSSVASEDREHVIFTSRDESALRASNSGYFTSMSFQYETEILLLIPNMDTTVGTTRVTDTILVESSAGELSLGELGSESSVLE